MAKYSRQAVVNLINSWVGNKESDGSFRFIIDLYNTLSPLPRGTKMQYSWAWCAATWSALAAKLKYTEVMPVEMSCFYLIEAAKKMNCWEERDDYVPTPGDAVLYDWQDSATNYSKTDNTGLPDHVGTVTEVYPNAGYFVVTEGNYSDSVKKRTVYINGRFIRGFIIPKYDDNNVTVPAVTVGAKDLTTVAREVILGKYGSGASRVAALKAAGYDPSAVQAKVNEILNGRAVVPSSSNQDQNQPSERNVVAGGKATSRNSDLSGSYVTTAALNLRDNAGTNKKSIVVIPKGVKVQNYGYYSIYNSSRWLYVQVIIDGVTYTGFCHSAYLKKV